MLKLIRDWKRTRRILLLKRAQDAFERADFSGTYYYLAKLTGYSPHSMRLAFQVAGMFKGKTTYQLLREALEPKLPS